MSGQVGLSADPPFHAQIHNHVIGTLRQKYARHERVIPASGPPNHGDLQVIRPCSSPLAQQRIPWVDAHNF